MSKNHNITISVAAEVFARVVIPSELAGQFDKLFTRHLRRNVKLEEDPSIDLEVFEELLGDAFSGNSIATFLRRVHDQLPFGLSRVIFYMKDQ